MQPISYPIDCIRCKRLILIITMNRNAYDPTCRSLASANDTTKSRPRFGGRIIVRKTPACGLGTWRQAPVSTAGRYVKVRYDFSKHPFPSKPAVRQHWCPSGNADIQFIDETKARGDTMFNHGFRTWLRLSGTSNFPPKSYMYNILSKAIEFSLRCRPKGLEVSGVLDSEKTKRKLTGPDG